MADQEIAVFIRAAQKGDTQAFEHLIQQFKGKVYRSAYAMLGDHMEAEDVAQEAFVKAFFSLNKLKSEYAFASWIGTITHHLCVDRLKASAKNQLSTQEEWLQVPDETNFYEQSELKLTIHDALQRLPVEQREVLVLRDMQGYHYEDMADIIGIPLGTVKSRLNTARQALRKLLETRFGVNNIER